MGEQLDLFKPELMSMDTASRNSLGNISTIVSSEVLSDIYEPYVEPTGFGIVKKYIRDRYVDIRYWFRMYFSEYPTGRPYGRTWFSQGAL